MLNREFTVQEFRLTGNTVPAPNWGTALNQNPPAAGTVTGLPAGLQWRINAAGHLEIYGTPTGNTTGAVNVTIHARSPHTAHLNLSHTVSIDIGRVPTVTSTLPVAEERVPYTTLVTDLRTNGVPSTVTWAAQGLPPAFTINPTTGIITSTTPPTHLEGRHHFTVTATNTHGGVAYTSDPHAAFIDVDAPMHMVTTAYHPAAAPLPNNNRTPNMHLRRGHENVIVNAGGRDDHTFERWIIDPPNALPASTNLTNPILTFTMPDTSFTATAQWRAHVDPTIEGPETASGLEGRPITVDVFTTGGYPVGVFDTARPANLPAGLNWNVDANGVGRITGTPQVGTARTAVYPVTISARNTLAGGTTIHHTVYITISRVPIITGNPADGREEVTYSATANGGSQLAVDAVPAATFSITGGSLPPGLTLSPTGAITGTPAPNTANANGTDRAYNFTVTASNGTENTTATRTITISAANRALTVANANWADGQTLGGTLNGQTPSGNHPRNSTVALNAGTRTGGWSFIEWRTNPANLIPAGSITNPEVSITMPNGAATVTAVWRQHTAPNVGGAEAITAREDQAIANTTYNFGNAGFPNPVTWMEPTVTGGSWPVPGLSFSNGILSGTPTAEGTYTVNIRAQNAVNMIGTRTVTITVARAQNMLTITNNPATSGTIPGQTDSGLRERDVTVNLDAGNRGGHNFSHWVVTPASALTGNANNAQTTLTMPRGAVTATAHWIQQRTPSIGNTNPGNFELGVSAAFNHNLEVTGTPYPTVALAAGSTLPAGISLERRGDAWFLVGSPTAQGTYTFSLTATNMDAAGTTQSDTKAITIIVGRRPTVSPAPTQGYGLTWVPYTHTFDYGTGYPTPEWLAATGLPAGSFTFNRTSGELSGSPTTARITPFTVTVSARNVFGTAERSFPMTIFTAPTITTNPNSVTGQPEGNTYSVTLQATSAPAAVWAIDGVEDEDGNALPLPITGLTLSATGQLQQSAALLQGEYNIAVTATNTSIPAADARRQDTATYTLTVTAPSRPLTVTNVPAGPPAIGQVPAPNSTPLRGETVNFNAGTRVRAADGEPYVFEHWSFSDGRANVTASTHSIVMTDTDLAATAHWGIRPLITHHSPTFGREAVAFSYRFRADATPAATWSIALGTVPPGLQLNAATGVLSGTPITEGEYTFDIKATNQYGDDIKTINLEIRPPLYEVVVRNSYYGGMVTIRQMVERGATHILNVGGRRNYEFAGWGTESNGVTLANLFSAQTSFVMPNNAVEIIAYWDPSATTPGGGGGGNLGESGGGGGGGPGFPAPPSPPAPEPPPAPETTDTAVGAATTTTPPAPAIAQTTPAAQSSPAAPSTPEPEPEPTPAPEPPSSGNETNVVEIDSPTIPLADVPETTTSGWALINLVLCVLTAIMMLVKVIPAIRNSYVGRRKSRLATFIPAIVAVTMFILTQDLSQTMRMVDMWTLWMAVIAVVQLFVFVFGAKLLREDEQTASDGNEY
jgi:hypothetical protein